MAHTTMLATMGNGDEILHMMMITIMAYSDVARSWVRGVDIQDFKLLGDEVNY